MFGKKKKEEFKKIESIGAEASDLKEFNEFPEENFDEAELPSMPSPSPKQIQKSELTDEEEIEMLKEKVLRKEKEVEERKRKEETKSTQQGLNLTEVLDIIQANTSRNLELLYLIRKNFGV